MRRPIVVSQWHALVDDLQASTQDFYQAVAKAVRARSVPEIDVDRVVFHESGVLSANRLYLRISRRRVAFDICAAPFGKSFFFSWRLLALPPSGGVALGLLMLILVGTTFVLCSGLGPRSFTYELYRVIQWTGLWPNPVVGFVAASIVGVLTLTVAYALVGAGTLCSIPLLGPILELILRPESYYNIDTALMFQESIRRALKEIIDGLMSQQGIRALSEQEYQPRLSDAAFR